MESIEEYTLWIEPSSEGRFGRIGEIAYYLGLTGCVAPIEYDDDERAGRDWITVRTDDLETATALRLKFQALTQTEMEAREAHYWEAQRRLPKTPSPFMSSLRQEPCDIWFATSLRPSATASDPAATSSSPASTSSNPASTSSNPASTSSSPLFGGLKP